MELEDLTYSIRGVLFTVHNTIGAGLFESVYEAALVYELQQIGLEVKAQIEVPVVYKDVKLDVGFRLDLLVEDQIIIEVKSVESLSNVHKKQLLTYLKLTKKKIGFLVNFNSSNLDKENLIRIIN
jgi:GxxExxY protein